MKEKIIVYIFISYLILFSGLGIILKDKDISLTERRNLKEFPEFSLNSNYLNEVEKYLLDHFPFRDSFRSIKANFNYHILNKLDNNGIYLHDNYIFKRENLNKKSISNFLNHINITKSYLTKDNNIYMVIIPDKNYYLESSNFLKLNYDYLYNEINNLDIKNIDIRNTLELNDYYETDTHWKQEKLDKVVKELNKEMHVNYIKENYKVNTYNNFYGVYYSEAAIKRDPDKLCYLENDKLNNINVNYLENKNLHTVYNLDKLTSIDSYEIYLDGASSFIEINNKDSNTDKELVIFRDSFASSITPLLTSNYKKITLIDNRYISSNNYLDLIEFNNQDILFMYSTLIVNNSFSLKN
ncbi:MAG: hypothetical protein IJ501_03710 [Bacilli bacterium]|nr:hypothetical protein [Bacilli bacterium]